MHRRIAILAAIASTLVLMGLSAGGALAAGDDNIPGIPVGSGTISGVVDETTDPYDVYSVKLFEGEEVQFALSADRSNSINEWVTVDLVAPEVKSVNDNYTVLAYVTTKLLNYKPDDVYTPAKDGIYHVIVRTTNASGMAYALTIAGSAEKPPNPAYLRLRTSATKVTKGRSVTLSAKLVNVDSTLIANYSVNLFRSYSGRSWTKVTALGSTSGEYSKKVRITRKTWFKMRFGGDAMWSSCSSRAVIISLR